MKYIKGKRPFAQAAEKGAQIRTFVHEPRGNVQHAKYSKAYMVSAVESDKMILASDIRCLIPLRTKGAILGRSFDKNMAGLKELTLTPEAFDALVAEGYIDTAGEVIEKETQPGEEPEAIEPADLNKDGVVDDKDVAIVKKAMKDPIEEPSDESAEKPSLDDEHGDDETDNDSASDTESDS